MLLDNATLWIGDGSKIDGHLTFAEGRIVDVQRGRYRQAPMANDIVPSQVIDLQGMALSPGLIDPFFCGGFGLSVVHDDLEEIGRRYVRIGVTGYVVAIGCLPWELTEQSAAHVRAAQSNIASDSAAVLGWYAEGPFMLPHCSGTSSREYVLPPSDANVDRLLESTRDLLTTVNVSPGTEGDVDAVQRLHDAGCTVSMAHSDARAERVLACVDAGTTLLGHAWDNNQGSTAGLGIPTPTLEHVALLDDRIRFIHLICDNVHVHPLFIKLLLRCRGAGTICLASDTLPRAGCPDGPFTWNDGRQFVKRNGACFDQQGNLAGSAMLLPDQWRNFVKLTGLPPHEAIETVTGNVARSLGIDDRVGLLAPGRTADLVLWDGHLRPQRIWRNGCELDNVDRFAETSQ